MVSGRRNPAGMMTWFASILIVSTLIRNPLYLLILFLAVALIFVLKRPPNPGPWDAFLKLGAVFFGVSLIYNVLISHYGATVITTLPSWIPAFGGNLTLEAAAYGAIFGLTFTIGIFAFAVLNITVGVSEIARFLPNAARGAATVITVTMNFVPATVATAREIREAQDIRGQTYGRGLTGAVRRAGAVVTPLIIAGLERAVVTAELMESRAYGNPEARSASGERLAWSAKDVARIILTVLPLPLSQSHIYQALWLGRLIPG